MAEHGQAKHTTYKHHHFSLWASNIKTGQTMEGFTHIQTFHSSRTKIQCKEKCPLTLYCSQIGLCFMNIPEPSYKSDRIHSFFYVSKYKVYRHQKHIRRLLFHAHTGSVHHDWIGRQNSCHNPLPYRLKPAFVWS